MGTYVQLMPRMVQRRMEEMESKAAENAKATAAAALLSAADASPASQSPVTSSPPPQVPPLLTPSVTDVGPDTRGSFSKPTGLDIPVELNAAVSTSATASDGKLSAAVALTPAAEAVHASVLNGTGNGPSYTAGFPQPPAAGTQIEFESPAPVSVPSKPTAISSVAAPTVSTSPESLSCQERATEIPPAPGQ